MAVKIQPAKEQIEDIRSSLRASNGIRLSEWEEEFFEKVSAAVEKGLKLSERQAEKLEEIWDRV